MQNRLGAGEESGQPSRLQEMSPEERVRSYDPEDAERNLPFFLFDPIPVWQLVPVFAVWGSDDRLVPAEKSRDLREKALEAAGNFEATLVVFPDT